MSGKLNDGDDILKEATVNVRNSQLWPMSIGTLWALVNDEFVRDYIQRKLGQEDSEKFIELVRRIASSFYDKEDMQGDL